MLNRLATRDAAAQRQAFNPRKARRLEMRYRRLLLKVARNVDDLVRTYRRGDPRSAERLAQSLRQYGEAIKPWAESVARRIVSDVNEEDKKAWREYSEQMGQALREELRTTRTGVIMRELSLGQAQLITSLPIEAAERVQKISRQALVTGERTDRVYEDIMRTGQVTAARARTIARTEIGRAQVTLTQARAEIVGSDGYIWRTARDADVRDSHAKMNGKFVRWDSPPTLDGLTGHAGALPNCRCYPEVLVPDE